MRADHSHAPFADRFDHLYAVISSQRFLNREGLGNEVPFFICPFKPTEALEMDKIRHQLVSRLEQNGIRILEINLYDLSIELLREREIWDQIIEQETEYEKPQIFNTLFPSLIKACMMPSIKVWPLPLVILSASSILMISM
jgi:hypothetical protein